MQWFLPYKQLPVEQYLTGYSSITGGTALSSYRVHHLPSHKHHLLCEALMAIA
jgi:hypothetical protein